MSTTLTNGIIIPDNGSRNWGGDLANNWNILDLNVGYMNDVKNRVTTLENSVAENTANIEINASNISALQTSKQDALSDQQIANIADVTNKANNADVVHKSGDEIIGGVKNFNDVVLGEQSGVIRIGNSGEGNLFCTLRYDGQIYNISKQFVPETNNKYNLGTSSKGWNAIYASALNCGSIEFSRVFGANHGGFIDFHYAGSTKDYTSRIIEDAEGSLKINSCIFRNDLVYHNSDNFCDLGTAQNRFKDIYATNAAINTSDRNAKTSIKNIDDDILEAWDKVSLISFKFKDAVEKKGDGARIHAGYIAQDIKEELAKRGIDACRYGLFCHNSWDAQEEKSHEEERTDEAGNMETVKVIDTPAIEAGETYGLRYIECLVVECAYLRKKNKELEDRITKLEENLKDRSLI